MRRIEAALPLDGECQTTASTMGEFGAATVTVVGPSTTVPEVGHNTVRTGAGGGVDVAHRGGVETARPIPLSAPAMDEGRIGDEPTVRATISARATVPDPVTASIVKRTDRVDFGANAMVVGKRGSAATRPTASDEPSSKVSVPRAIRPGATRSPKNDTLVSVGAVAHDSWAQDVEPPAGIHDAPTPPEDIRLA